MQLTKPLLILASLCEYVIAYPFGAGGCTVGNTAVQGPHLTRSVTTGSLEAGGFTVTLDNAISLVADQESAFTVGKANALTITGTKPFKGFLLRLGETGGVVTDMALSGTGPDIQAAMVCTGIEGVGGVTHTSNSDKTTISPTLKLDTVASALPLDVTIVVSNSGTVSEYYYSRFLLNAVLPGSLPVVHVTSAPVQTSTPTPAPVLPVTHAPVQTSTPTPAPVLPVTPAPVQTSTPTPAPVVPVTPAPVVPVTPAPVIPVTPAPVVPVTPAPVIPVTPAPVVPVTPAPVVPMTPAPVVPMTPAPVVPMTPAPVVPMTPAPVVPVTPAPVVPVTPAPVVPVTPAPVVPLTPAPVVPLTPTLVVPLTPAPVVPLTPTPVVPVTPAPVIPVAPAPMQARASTNAPVVPVTPAPIVPLLPTPLQTELAHIVLLIPPPLQTDSPKPAPVVLLIPPPLETDSPRPPPVVPLTPAPLQTDCPKPVPVVSLIPPPSEIDSPKPPPVVPLIPPPLQTDSPNPDPVKMSLPTIKPRVPFTPSPVTSKPSRDPDVKDTPHWTPSPAPIPVVRVPIVSTLGKSCQDDPDYRFIPEGSTIERGCFWLSKRPSQQVNYCDITTYDQIAIACEETCKLCSETCCDNNDVILDFTFEGESYRKDCAFVRKHTVIQGKYCRKGSLAYTECKETCNNCGTTKICRDSEVFSFVTNGVTTTRTCRWLAKQDYNLLRSLCQSDPSPESAAEQCSNTCGMCNCDASASNF